MRPLTSRPRLTLGLRRLVCVCGGDGGGPNYT